MKTAVFGATGFVAKRVLEELLGLGVERLVATNGATYQQLTHASR